MKNFRKFLVTVLTLALSVFLVIPAFPASGYFITVTNSTHTYEVYQIFSGYIHENILTDVKWGQNGVGEKGAVVSQEILRELESLNGKTDREKLEVIEKYADLNPENKFCTVSAEQPSQALAPGYYLVKDIDGTLAGMDDSYTTYIVRLVKDIEISPKSGKTTAEKTVTDLNDVTGETIVGESADYDLNDEVPFQLSATIDSEYARYGAYKLVFHDTLSKGLTFNAESVAVRVDGSANSLVKGQDYQVITSGLTDGCTFEVLFTDLKAIKSVTAGSVITVDYTATLNENAVIGKVGNLNKLTVEYSNNPNDETGAETGKTPEETAIVFTYQMMINKITENPEYDPSVEGSLEYIPLSGAVFKISKKVKNEDGSHSWKFIDPETSEDGTVFTFKGLDEGQYALQELIAPRGYNKIGTIYFEITSTVDGKVLTSLSGMQTDKEGVVLNGDAISVTFTSNAEKGKVVTDVVNVKGTQLPETGGIGTMIFYTIGGSMVAMAVILFLSKKYFDKREE